VAVHDEIVMQVANDIGMHQEPAIGMHHQRAIQHQELQLTLAPRPTCCPTLLPVALTQARKRAEAAAYSARLSKLIGRRVLDHWLEGREYVTGQPGAEW
jgi:hypothetical protein